MVNDIFKLGLGLDVPLPPTQEEHLQSARNLVHGGVEQDVRIEELYQKDSFQSGISKAFEFMPEERELLQPFKLQKNLENLSMKLKNSSDANVAEILEKEVTQLLNNNDLLRMYCSLMLN